MDAVKFLKEYDRMCKSYNFDCNECGIHKVRKGEGCIETVVEHPEEVVAAVEKWSAEHPVKTRQSAWKPVHTITKDVFFRPSTHG